MSFACVVSVYKEDINYLKKYRYIFSNIYIYLKDETQYDFIVNDFSGCKVEVLPNIGRESQTYAYHMSKYYESLEDYTCFIQGNPFDHDPKFYEQLKGYSFRKFIGLSKELLVCDKYGSPHHGSLLVGRTYEELKQKNSPEYFFFFQGAQFIVCKEYIQNNEKTFYNDLNKLHNEIYDLPWILERLWLYLLVPEFNEHMLQSCIL
jgi:hypothetical protein